MNIWPQLLALLIIFLFAFLLFIAIRSSRIQAAVKSSQAESLGFSAVTSEPRELLRRVEELFRRRPDQAILVDQVYSKEGLDEKEYLFDVSDAHDDDSEIGSEVFGLLSSQLALPHFHLVVLPDVFGGSAFGGLMETVLDKALAAAEKHQGLERIDFPSRPDFDRTAFVFGQDPDAVRELLGSFHPSSYTSSEMPVFIGGMDDFLAVDFSQMGGTASETIDLISRHYEFTQITRYFLRKSTAVV